MTGRQENIPQPIPFLTFLTLYLTGKIVLRLTKKPEVVPPVDVETERIAGANESSEDETASPPEGCKFNNNRKQVESMSTWRPRESEKGGLPHLSFITRKPAPFGTEFKAANTGVTQASNKARGDSDEDHADCDDQVEDSEEEGEEVDPMFSQDMAGLLELICHGYGLDDAEVVD
jgi:hypothetical protein